VDRLPVQTYVMEHDDQILHEAIRRELRRGGQVFYLHNAVENIRETAARLQQALPDAVLKVIGPYDEDPDYYRMCRQTVETLQLKNVEFTGSVDVAKVFPEIDIMLLSSISEGQPLAVLEGQAAARPFVTTNVGCCRELIYGGTQDILGPAGAVVAPMDYEQMAKEIIRLSRNFRLRHKMGHIGRRRVEKRYTYENFIESYREIYQEMKGGNG